MPTGAQFVFEPFELDPARRRLTSSGEPVAISDRHLDVLLLLVGRAGHIIPKDDLLQAGWQDVAVGDNSLEQAISNLRRLLGTHPSGVAYIETVPRRGYRFGVAVARRATRESDAGLDALLAPHRAFLEGRAALETLEGEQVARARHAFEGAVRGDPEHAAAHVGLANACVMQFEMTRADPVPDTSALTMAVHHAREGCRLDPQFGEAWATLGFVLDRTGHRMDAPAASRRAMTLEPDNWRHHFRLAYVSWGEERLRAAQRTLALLPDFPLAHWLAATVHVARQALDEAERELSYEQAGQLSARECCANTWYAIGALRLRQGRAADAGAAFEQALARVATHPMARVGRVAAGSKDRGSIPPAVDPRVETPGSRALSVDEAMFRAVQLVLAGAHADAARMLDEALAGAAPGNAGWLLPLEPMLQVTLHPDIWNRALAHLRNRAA